MQATTRPEVVQALVAGKARILQNLLSQDPFLQTHPQYPHFVQMGEVQPLLFAVQHPVSVEEEKWGYPTHQQK
jgi:hypothetical protein